MRRPKRCPICGQSFTGRCPNASAGWHTPPEDRPLANLPERPVRPVVYLKEV